MHRPACHFLLLLGLGGCTAVPAPAPTAAAPAAVVGRLVDPDGRPIAEATVTVVDAALPEAAFGRGAQNDWARGTVLAARNDWARGTVLAARATTDANGRFAVLDLAPGRYRLRAGHAAFCLLQLEPMAKGAQTLDLGTLAMARGAVVEGYLVYRQQTAYELHLTGPAATAGPPPTGGGGVAYSRPDGSYRFPCRVPPGTYELYGRPWNPAMPFAGSDFGAFQVAVVVPPGTELVQVPAQQMRL